MKMSRGKKFALILTMVLLVPVMWNQSEAVASAATPTFTESKIEIDGEGGTYQLAIKDMVQGSTYLWSSSNTKVARVSSKGIITTTGAGSATIKCKITYPSKRTKTLSCKVTVTIPATEVRINNAAEVSGAHIILLGDSFNFNRDIVPANSSDKTFWAVGGGDPDCIRVDDSSSGTVTALKIGKVILTATAAKTTYEEDASKSIVNDAIIIEVIGPTATVRSADITGSTEIKVVFDSPVDASTVIGTNNKLLSSIEISMRKNIKGVLAKDPGELTASLSADGKALTITSKEMFDGEYGINFTSSIKTTGGIAIEEYYKRITYTDNVAPYITGTVLDDTGMVATIQFNEAIDFSGFKVSNAKLIPTGAGTTVDPRTIIILNNTLNYVVSPDKKSLTINLFQMPPMDYGKMFIVTITGIEDLSGNIPESYTLSTVLSVDNTLKAQARPQYAVRTSYNTLTVYFDRAIQKPGMAQVNNGSMMYGIVDDKDSKKVNYTIYDYDAALAGQQKISVGFYNSYNVNPSDTFANEMHSLYTDFTADKARPILLTAEYNSETGILLLTFSESVTSIANTGIFNSTLVTATGERIPNTGINYTKMESSDSKQIKLLLNMSLTGQYTFDVAEGFAMDSFKNLSTSRTFTINNQGGAASELPPPYLITQSTTNLSQIYLEFSNRLDEASALNKSNYSIAGIPIISVDLYKNTNNNGATVILTVADGSIDVTIERPVTISGIMGYNGALTAMSSHTTNVELKDNKRPMLLGTPEYDKSAMNIIRLNFNEAIEGTMVVKVTQFVQNYPIEYANIVTVSGNSVVITLSNVPERNTNLMINILDNDIRDVSGNMALPINPQLGVLAAY